MRFWEFDNFSRANSGCQPQDGWLYNTAFDWSGTFPGLWFLVFPDWQGGRIDGCPTEKRTVAELSFPDRQPGFEGTVNHRAWYVLASVPGPSIYNFDLIRGGDRPGAPGPGQGLNPAVVKAQVVGGVTIEGRTAACTGDPATTVGVPSPTTGFFEVDVRLVNPAPDYYTEIGRNDPTTRLIDGFQIVYALDDTEPVSSDPCALSSTGSPLWSPVRDPSAPVSNLPPVPLGTCGPIKVALPDPPTGATRYWLATRIIYTDCSTNGSRIATGNCTTPNTAPILASAVSSHCGPVLAP